MTAEMPQETRIHIGVEDTAALMAEADLGIGAASNLGWYEEVQPLVFAQAVERLGSDPARLHEIGLRAARICDGLGRARIGQQLAH